jgi:glutamyl-tRNA synthetase
MRFRVPGGIVQFNDGFSGLHTYDVAKQLGDFIIAKADGTPAYQLAVVVDDADMNITTIVRGDDLLDSTPRQILLYGALDLNAKIPAYYHLPLILGPDGKRLAKRHGDSRLSHYRNQGIPASKILSLLAEWSNISTPTPSQTAADLLPHFDLNNLPKTPIMFNPAQLLP